MKAENYLSEPVAAAKPFFALGWANAQPASGGIHHDTQGRGGASICGSGTGTGGGASPSAPTVSDLPKAHRDKHAQALPEIAADYHGIFHCQL